MQNHYWVVERFVMNRWEPCFVSATRSLARLQSAQKREPTRIRKFVAA